METKLIETIPVANTLGEGVSWDSRTGILWWTDIQENSLYKLQWSNGEMVVFDLPARLCSFGFTSNKYWLVAAFADGFYLLCPDTGERELISLIEADNPLTRMNEGRLDRQGCFWAGSMVEQPFAGATADAALYRLEAGLVTRQLDGIGISNGLAFSPDGNTMFFADTPTRIIRQYDLDGKTGALSAERDFAHSPVEAGPDGAVIDSDGYYWSAQWGNGQVVRYAPDGRVDHVIQTPSPQVACVEFGGPDLDLLFVTTARESLNEKQLEEFPLSGHMFVYQTSRNGIALDKFYPVSQEYNSY